MSMWEWEKVQKMLRKVNKQKVAYLKYATFYLIYEGYA